MGRRRDAALTLLVGVPVAAGVAVFRPPVTLAAVLVGVFGVLTLEAALLSQQARVRTLWDDRRVQAVAVAVTLVCVAVAVVTVGPTVLVAVLTGLVTYLLVLLAVELRNWATG
ncbi:hypothetical protein [Haloferax sp. YSMS24]|uniref:hypothetical protein n=1 Tax=Haloferax sp. YSMS24 TaxID=3388425 RepID=UPI00398C9F1E